MYLEGSSSLVLDNRPASCWIMGSWRVSCRSTLHSEAGSSSHGSSHSGIEFGYSTGSWSMGKLYTVFSMLQIVTFCGSRSGVSLPVQNLPDKERLLRTRPNSPKHPQQPTSSSLSRVPPVCKHSKAYIKP